MKPYQQPPAQQQRPDPPPRKCPSCERDMQFLRSPSNKGGEFYCGPCHVSIDTQGQTHGRDYDAI